MRAEIDDRRKTVFLSPGLQHLNFYPPVVLFPANGALNSLRKGSIDASELRERW